MAEEMPCLKSFGHSGGAVPDSHRSSLFRRSKSNLSTDHQRTFNAKAVIGLSFLIVKPHQLRLKLVAPPSAS